MVRNQSIHKQFKNTEQNNRTENFNKKTIVLKKAYKLKVFEKYIEVFEDITYTITFNQINEIFIHTSVEVSLKELIKMAKQIPVKFIDSYGYILGGVYYEQ